MLSNFDGIRAVGVRTGDESRRIEVRRHGRGARASTRADSGARLARALWILLLATLVSMTWAAGRASAQADATAEPAPGPITDEGAGELGAEKRSGLEEIVVTAARREADIQDVPASISSFNADDIIDQGLTNLNVMQFNIPSFFSGTGLTRVTARGIGSEIVGPGIDPGFAVHVNGVFSSREATGLLDFLDIQRVEVLRGPQGTRYGRNSTGGTVNVITMRALPDFDVFGDIQYASFRDLLVRGAINAPLIEDKLFARIAVITHFSDGYMRIESPEVRQTLNDSGNVGLRATLSWLPTDNFHVDLIGAYADTNRNGAGRKFQGPYFNGPTDGVGGPPGAGLLPGSDYTGAIPNPADPNIGTENVRQSEESNGWALTLDAVWELDWFTLQSITGYQYTNYFLHRGSDTSSLQINNLDLKDQSWQVSQELLFTDPGSESYSWMVGANYQYDKTPVTRLYIPNQQDTAFSAQYNILDPVTFALISPIGETYDTFNNLETEVGTNVFGIFASGDYTFFEKLTLGGGVRYSYTDRDWNDTSRLQTYAPPGVPGVPPIPGIAAAVVLEGVHQKKSWNGVTGEAFVRYDIVEKSNVYFSFSRGERFGGFQFLETGPFQSETVNAYEVGSKNRFWDDKIQLNVMGFYYDYDNPQITQVVGGAPVTDNAPSARTYGIEAEFDYLVTDEFLIGGTFGWLEARYDEDYFSQDTTLPGSAPQNINGNRLNRSPKFTASVGAQYTFDFDGYGKVVPRLDFYYRDRVTFRQYGNPLDEAAAYTRTDLRLTWSSQDDQFWVQGFVQNLENNNVKSGLEVTSTIYRTNYYTAPLNGGVRIGYNFR